MQKENPALDKSFIFAKKVVFLYKDITTKHKECLETKYWLTLLKETNYISDTKFKPLFENADEL